MRTATALVALGGLSFAALGCAGWSGASQPTPTTTATATGTATPTATPTPTPKPDPLVLAPVSPQLEGLRQRLEQEIAAYAQRVGGNFAVAVTDLQTSETVHVNGDDRNRVPGCTMNFFVLLSVVKDLQAG